MHHPGHPCSGNTVAIRDTLSSLDWRRNEIIKSGLKSPSETSDNDNIRRGSSSGNWRTATAELNIGRNVIQYSFSSRTLQQITEVKIVTELWCTCVTIEMTDYFNYNSTIPEYNRRLEEWKKIENRVSNSLSKLSLPKVINGRLLQIVKPLGDEIRYWIKWNNASGLLSSARAKRSINDLVWTSGGTIDKKETTKILLSKEWLDAYEKYELACTFCLADYINTITREFFKSGYLESVDITRKPMVYYWTCYITKNTKLEKIVRDYNRRCSLHSSINEHVLHLVYHLTLQYGTDAAVRYLWNELSDEEKKKYISRDKPGQAWM
uniref:Uncharacterized protein n=1 Tax=Strigamia maritima TaxID=126957 RepID=T1JKV0_STRMM